MKFLEIFFGLCLSMNFCTAQTKSDSSILVKFHQAPLKNGWPESYAYDFSAVNLTGQIIKLSDYKGKYVLLDFWASWCKPCRSFNPTLIKLYKEHQSNQIEFIGIAHDVGNEKKWRDAISRDNISIWPQILDNNIANEYSIYSIPVLILIDPSGKIMHRFGGEGQSKKKLKEVLKNLFHTP